MAAIKGFTEIQNAALQGVTVGSLLLVQKVAAYAHYDPDEDDLEDDEGDEQDHGEEEDESAVDIDQDGDEGATEGNNPAPAAAEQPGIAHVHAHPAQASAASQVASSPPDTSARNLDVEVDGPATGADTLNTNASSQNEGTSADDDDEEAETKVFVPTMYIITSVMKGGDSGNITELGIAPLSFNHKVGSLSGKHSYHIFGNECKAYHDCEDPCEDLTSITTVATGEHLTFMVNPAGDYVRRFVHGTRRCIETCSDGFLDNTACLSDMTKDYTPEMLEYEQNVTAVPGFLQKPICPVCIGPALLREQQALQQGLLATSVVDFGLMVEYLAKLNLRRAVIRSFIGGYRFVQLDERQWGYGFDDMLSDEDEDGVGAGYGGQFEHWEEAQDPNAIPKLRPASDETIAVLPRKRRSEVTFEGDDETCCIDREAFDLDSVLVQLPCGHAKFHESCIVTWLKQYNNCPICREVVPGESAEAVEKGPNHRAAMLRMTLREALTSLGFETGTDFEAVDKEMLPVIYASAREDRGGWRTETAIARLEAALAMEKDVVEQDAGLVDDRGKFDDSHELHASLESAIEEPMEDTETPKQAHSRLQTHLTSCSTATPVAPRAIGSRRMAVRGMPEQVKTPSCPMSRFSKAESVWLGPSIVAGMKMWTSGLRSASKTFNEGVG